LKKAFSPRCFETQELREKTDKQYNKGKPTSFDTVAVHDAAALLKLFLRELPEPLLTSERVNAFIQVDSTCTLSLSLFTEFCRVLQSLCTRFCLLSKFVYAIYVCCILV